MYVDQLVFSLSASYKGNIFVVLGRFCFGIFVRPECFSWKTEDRKLKGFFLAFRSAKNW